MALTSAVRNVMVTHKNTAHSVTTACLGISIRRAPEPWSMYNGNVSAGS
jgi:hypothetical protein